MNDEIKLPPLPDNGTMLTYGAGTLRNYARLAVEQDRARREKQGPNYRSKVLALHANGEIERGIANTSAQHNICIRWTPERVWIESEKNRELARMLREGAYVGHHLYAAADALDGGEQ